MRRGGAVLVAVVLALAGCRGADTKSGEDRWPGIFANRSKAKDKDAKDARDPKGAPAKGPTWLDDVGKMPGAATGVPKAGSWTNPGDPNFNAKAEAQDALGGRVLDPTGKPARNVFVRIDPVGAPAGGPAAIGIYTDNSGYFFTRGLKPGKSYELTAEAQQDGKPLAGAVQTKVPNPILTIVLRDDLPPRAGGLPPPKGPNPGFPPAPRPADDAIPPMGLAPKPEDGAWSPGGPAGGTPPATIGGGTGAPKTPGGGVPPPDDLTFPPPDAWPVRPENIADGPKDPFKPPPANIPGTGGPPVPALPKLPPPFEPKPGGRSSMDVHAGAKLALLDTLERPWDLDAVRPGTLVLVEFMTTSCGPCREQVPFLKQLQARYGASGLQLAGVVCDELPQKQRAEAAAKYVRDHHLNYALFVEPGEAGSVRDRFDVEGYPHAVLMDTSGRVLWKGHPGKRAELESAIKQHLRK